MTSEKLGQEARLSLSNSHLSSENSPPFCKVLGVADLEPAMPLFPGVPFADPLRGSAPPFGNNGCGGESHGTEAAQ